MANISEIARLANVSRSTVSRVLNNQPYVKESKRQAVLDVINMLKYVPNRNAINLSKGRTNIIGVMIPMINHPFFNTLMSGIGEACSRFNLSLLVNQTGNLVEKEQTSFDQLRYKQIDGLIIASSMSSLDKINEVYTHGPIVSCERSEGSHPQIVINHSKGLEIMISHLIEQNHKNIALCIGNPDSGVGKNRKKAFYDLIAEKNINHVQEWYFDKKYTFEDGQSVMDELYQLEHKPSAIIVGNDYVAAGIIHQAKVLSVDVPNTLAVTGFDNHSISEALQITTIHQPIHQLGVSAVETIYKLINHQEVIAKESLPIELVTRKST